MPQRQWEGQRHGMLVLLWKKWKLGGRCKVQGRLMRGYFDSKDLASKPLSLPIRLLAYRARAYSMEIGRGYRLLPVCVSRCVLCYT